MKRILDDQKTDTLVVHFASLPVTDLSISYLTQIIEPIVFTPTISCFSVFEVINSDSEDVLKAHILRAWKEQLFNIDKNSNLGWLRDINKVELIECNLLTPIRKD